MTRAGLHIARKAERAERAGAASQGHPPAPSLEPRAPAPMGMRDELLANLDALYRFILVRVGFNQSVADDVLQQTAETALRTRSPGAVESPEGWLRGIARNLVRRYWREASRTNGSAAPDPAHGRLALAALESDCPAEALQQRELRLALLWAIASLPAADQRLLYAVYRHGATHEQLAGELGCTAKGIEMKLYRTRARLREALAACGDDP